MTVTKAFLATTGREPEAPTTIIHLSSTSAGMTPPGMSSYSLTKVAIVKLATFMKDEHPSITTVAVNPGVVSTDMGNSIPFVIPSMKDTPEPSGGLAVWLASGDKSFLSGRYVDANWDVEELEARKEEIQEGLLLTVGPRGKFGKNRE
jgi:NAD(P)-dependent dehydrogenase (short-subunit alcohol dehydrogenase family)